MKAFSTLCALSLATLIAAPLAAQAADDCNANGHEQHQKAPHDDCGKHAGEGRKEHGDAREPGKGPGEHRDEARGPGKGQGDRAADALCPARDDRNLVLKSHASSSHTVSVDRVPSWQQGSIVIPDPPERLRNVGFVPVEEPGFGRGRLGLPLAQGATVLRRRLTSRATRRLPVFDSEFSKRSY